jgi:hypothetical protein
MTVERHAAQIGGILGRLLICSLCMALGASPQTGRAQDELPGTPNPRATFVNPLMLPPPTPTPVAFTAPPAPAECIVEPRPEEDFVAVTDFVTPSDDRSAQRSLASEEELPQGQPADSGTMAAIEALERERVACLNAGDWRRFLAFYSDEAFREILASYGPDGGADIAADFLASPEPFELVDQVLVQVRDVRVLPDGHVAAIVDTCEQVDFHVYRQIDGRWLIVEGFRLDRPRSSCIRPPIFYGTPPAL